MLRHAIAATAALACAVGTAAAQRPTDTTGTDSLRATRALEGVIVRAVRANGTAPIAQTTVSRAAISRRSFAQDVPLMLQGSVPSLTAHAESGTSWGYSYLRLRGIDQSRINLSIDGIPLNDPEDQVFYFANFADLASSVQSVQVQRGVGTSGTGTASFAGSVNFETKPIFGVRRQSAAEVQVGSYGARRVMLEGNTGLLPGGVAASARLSALRSNSFRRNAGVQGLSGMAQAGWIGARDIVKASVLAGQLRDTLSYLAVPVNELRQDRRINPLTPEEQDRFSQTLASLSHTRQLGTGIQYASTLYRVAATGDYDVRFDSTTIGTYGLAHTWYGLTSALNLDRGGVRVNAGVNANLYGRDHYAFVQPDRRTETYRNTGHKRDASAFAKLALVRGRATWFGDLQVRHAEFRYTPDKRAGFAGAEPSISWNFLNPKIGLTWAATPRTELFASVGRTTREPTRSDLFSGNDDIAQSVLTDIGGLTRLRPESVIGSEAGVRLARSVVRLELNAYRMDFSNEIARIGALSALGTELRSNVGASVRQGIEMDLRWRPLPSLEFTTVGALSHNRIRSFIDSTGVTPVARRDVPPLLTPSATASQRVDWRVASRLDLGLEARHQGMSYLRNDGDRSLTLPASTVVDAMLRVPLGTSDLSVRGVNLGNSKRFGSGYAVGGVPNYFILPPRSVYVTVRLTTR